MITEFLGLDHANELYFGSSIKFYIEKAGIFADFLDMDKNCAYPLPTAVVGISHYHQPVDCHPRSSWVGEGLERVELVTRGKGWIEQDEERVEVRPGSLIWQIEGDITINRSDFRNPYSCLSVNFQIENVTGRRVARFTRWDDLAEVRRFTDELIHLWASRSIPLSVLNTYAYGRLYTQALLGQDMVQRMQLPEPVQRARALIERDYALPLRIRDLAKVAQCSEPYVHELFKKHLGLSPHRLIMESRLKEASRRLTSSYDPIKQIAHDTGFSHSAAFCHAFKGYTGLTPAVYRRQSYMP